MEHGFDTYAADYGDKLVLEMIADEQKQEKNDYDYDKLIYDLECEADMLKSKADNLDYAVSACSGLLCGLMDILWVGEFSLQDGRQVASDNVSDFVTKVAKHFGCDSDDLTDSVKFLERMFPLAADGNTKDFGGGLQHHLRDFAHHPTAIGLIFSLLTQFTYKSYGTDTAGKFIIVDVPETHKAFIGDDIPTKIINGTIEWFFHLVSDMAGSSSSAASSGGTGIPGPILAIAKELSVLPIFRDINVGDNTFSQFLSKLFNGTFFMKRDENGNIIKDTVIKFDLRGELGLAAELGKQAIPVIANECIVRTFYFIRRFASELKRVEFHSFDDVRLIDWDSVKPVNSPTLTRMLTISTAVFETLDITEAIVSKKYWLGINYAGVCRFMIALNGETVWALKRRDVNRIKQMYEEIRRNTFTKTDENIYERIGAQMDYEKIGLTAEQAEILYNIEFQKVLNDINKTNIPVAGEAIKSLKIEWLEEWKESIRSGFSSFIQREDAQLNWFSKDELIAKVEENDPHGTWLRLALLEAMIFEPYYALTVEKDKKGKDVPSKKYDMLGNPVSGYNKFEGDNFLDSLFNEDYYEKGFIHRLRKCYGKVFNELNEVLKAALKTVSITAAVAIPVIILAGAFAPGIAVALVGSNFTGLSGAALTSACLAYLGGGAVAMGGLGMAGGTAVIVGGGAVLGLGVGAGVGGTVGAVGIMGKKGTILQSAKLLVSVREIFLNDEHDMAYSNSIYEKLVNNIADIEKGLVDLRLKAATASPEEKKKLTDEIKNAEESVNVMKIAMKSMNKFISSFELGESVQAEQEKPLIQEKKENRKPVEKDRIKIAKETISITKQGWYINSRGEKVLLETGNERTVYAVDLYPPEKSLDILVKCKKQREALKTEGKCTFYLVDADSFEAAKPFSEPLVMNFANAHTAGGGFLLGAKAQEEALCRTSTLYASISNKKALAMYLYNNTHISPVDSDYFTISPNVIVFRNSDLDLIDVPYKVSVVTIAAPNRRGGAVVSKKETLDDVMTVRLRKMLYTAADNGYRNLVLGAWGCGAFGNNPTDVAGYFKKLFFEENLSELFDNVVFAILGKEKNYNAFKDVLGEKIDKFSLDEEDT